MNIGALVVIAELKCGAAILKPLKHIKVLALLPTFKVLAYSKTKSQSARTFKKIRVMRQLFGIDAPSGYSYPNNIQLHLRGRCSYEVLLHLEGTASPTRYSFAYQVQLHPRGTAAPTRYSCTHKVQLHPRGTAARGTALPTSYSYTYTYALT